MTPRAYWFALFALLIAPMTATAQISLGVLNGTVQTPVTGSYPFGAFAPTATKDVTFVMTNTTGGEVTVCGFGLSASGPGPAIGFAIVNTSTPPISLGVPFDFFVRFTGGPVGGYIAYLSVNYVVGAVTCSSPQSSTPPIQLTASVVQAAVLTVASPCTGPDAAGNVSFGRIQQTQPVKCTFTLSNPYTAALAISPVALTQPALSPSPTVAVFQSSVSLGSFSSIPAGQSITFDVTFTPPAALPYSGALTVGPETFPLAGTGFLSPMPAPSLTFNSSKLQSGNQYVLTAALAAAAPSAFNGTITMSFTPSITGTNDDTAVKFVATSNRVVSFSVPQGATALLLNGLSGATFSTGTTAGTITFTVNAGAIGVSGSATTTVTIPPMPVAITASGASNLTSELVVSLTGFDNSYSLGPMTFTFFDRNGKQLGSVIQADFSQQFQLFYRNQAPGGVTAGSAFLVAVSFPITGNASTVGSVNVQVNNTAGTTTINTLNFP